MIVINGDFLGTVSRDRFGFLCHAWSVLGLNMGRGLFQNFLDASMILKRKNVTGVTFPCFLLVSM
jgi:hypothetical protein